MFVRFTLSLGLLVGAAALLWYVVFPWADPYMPFNDSAVEIEDSAPGPDSAPEEEADTEEGAGTGEDAGETGGNGDEEGIVGVDVPVGGDNGS